MAEVHTLSSGRARGVAARDVAAPTLAEQIANRVPENPIVAIGLGETGSGAPPTGKREPCVRLCRLLQPTGLINLVVQGLQADSEFFRRSWLIAIVPLQRFVDGVHLEIP